MKNYKIVREKTSLDKKTISKYKPAFGQLLNEYETMHKPYRFLRRLYKKPQIILLFVVFVAIVLAIIFG